MPVVDRPVVPAPRRDRRRTASVVAAGLALVVAATACTDADGVEDDRLVISVGDKPSAGTPEELAFWETRVAQFEEQHPDIRIDGSEVAYDPQRYTALLAGDDVPTVLLVPFTEPQGMLARGEVAEISGALAATGLGDVVNPDLQPLVSDGAGGVYGVPVSAYAMGLVYNRALFEEAGLDPSTPPRTWDEVRDMAGQISRRTDAAGFGHMGAGNFGGWILTAETYGFGGRVQDEQGELTLTEGPLEELLEVLRGMREDGSADPQTGYTSEAIAQNFAGGRLGMYVAAPDVYGQVVDVGELPPEDFGMGAMPRGGDADAYASLTGGTVAVVSPTADAAEQRAAMEWIEFFHLERYVDRDAALAEVEAQRTVENSSLGLPALSPVAPEAYDRWLSWVADEVDVPLGNFAGYTATLGDAVEPEPRRKAQLVYGELDGLVQAVLGREDVDVAELVAETERTLAEDLDRDG